MGMQLYRLNNIDVNEDEWIIKGNRDKGYKLVNKKDDFIYSISGDIAGIKQLDYNTFLVFDTISVGDMRQIYKVKLDNGEKKREFSQDFRKYVFLSNDKILFDNRSVYSISKNEEVKEFDWLKYKYIEVHEDENNNQNTVLYVEQRLSCFPQDEYIQFLVDTEKFKPIKQLAYSTLRGKIINLTDDFKLEDLIAEDNYYANIVSKNMFKLYLDSKKDGRSKILTKKQAKNIYTCMKN